ncbi:hypothetical protein Hanom_Chr04g00368021 [Helianthus anomalus]
MWLRTSSSVESSANRTSYELIPTESQAFFLLRTYVAESFLSPTRITANPGTIPISSFILDISTAISSLMSFATRFPSITVARVSLFTCIAAR